MKTNLIRTAAVAATLAISGFGAAQASPVRPVASNGAMSATQVQYYGDGYHGHHAYRPPHHYHHSSYHHRHGYDHHDYDHRY
jgi:hypothetical protein